MSIALFFAGFDIFYIFMFYTKNQENKTSVYIKENGLSYSGKVLHVQETEIRNPTTKMHRIVRHLLVEFNDGTQNRLIVTKHFPHFIDTNAPTLVDLALNKFNMNDYKQSYQENIIKHTQYMGRGYISFDALNPKDKKFVYNDSKNKNFENEITCKVFVYDGKYVIDDFEGIDVKKIKRNSLFLKLFIIFLFASILCVLFIKMNS